MALGEQFENTFWFGDDDRLNTSLVRRTSETDVSRGPQLTHHTNYGQIQRAEIRSHGRDGFVDVNQVYHDPVDPADDLEDTLRRKFDAVEPEKMRVSVTHEEGKYGGTIEFKTVDRPGTGKAGEERPNIQGMLFSPYVGTGLSQDPLVPEGAREDAARRALRLEDTPENLERYKASIKKKGWGAVGDKAARAHQQVAVDSLASSTMPIQEMERMAELGTAGTLVKPTSGRASFDSGGPDGGQIVLNRDTKTDYRTVEHPARVEYKTTRGEAMPNPKFWDWYDKNSSTSGSTFFFENVLDSIPNDKGVVWSHPETGDVLPRDLDELNNHPVFEGIDKPFSDTRHGPMVETDQIDDVESALRNAGYVANIYAGKSRELKKVTHTEDINFAGDFSYAPGAIGDYKTIRAHLRHTPGSVEEIEREGGSSREKITKPVIRGGSKVTVHEMGHAKDADRLRGGDRKYHLGGTVKLNREGIATSYYGYGDPIAEGAADGYADMYGGNDPTLLQSAIADPTFAGTHHTRTGYSTEYGNFKTNTHRALYSAIRAHVGMGGSFDDIPDRANIVDTPELRMEDRLQGVAKPRYAFNAVGVDESHIVNEATLGHVWESMPHVREHLTTLGYDRVARDAAKVNRKHREQWTRDNVGEQLSFDDL